jgi:trimethylamine:corrinoid methyltransferase-like protein
MSAEMMLIHMAWLGAAEYLLQGIRLDDERLGLANLAAVGASGTFLTDDLTLRFLRGGEFFAHPLFDQAGDRAGGRSLLERAHEQADQIVASHVSPVSEPMRAAIEGFFAQERQQVAAR